MCKSGNTSINKFSSSICYISLFILFTYFSIYRELIYRELSNIRRIKSQNLNDSRLVLHLYLPNLLKSGVK